VYYSHKHAKPFKFNDPIARLACIINAVFTRQHITYAAPWYVYVHNNTIMLPNDVYYGANVMLYYTLLPTDHYLLYTDVFRFVQ